MSSSSLAATNGRLGACIEQGPRGDVQLQWIRERNCERKNQVDCTRVPPVHVCDSVLQLNNDPS